MLLRLKYFVRFLTCLGGAAAVFKFRLRLHSKIAGFASATLPVRYLGETTKNRYQGQKAHKFCLIGFHWLSGFPREHCVPEQARDSAEQADGGRPRHGKRDLCGRPRGGHRVRGLQGRHTLQVSQRLLADIPCR